MIKLSRQQIDAISVVISTQIVEENKRYNDALRKKEYVKFFKTPEGKAFKLLKLLRGREKL
jgi:hypothetical protein